MPLIMLPGVNRSLTQPGNSYVLFGYSRKKSLLAGAISHTQFISSNHAHIHLVHIMHTHSQRKASKMMLRARALLWEEVKLVMQPGMSVGTGCRKTVSHSYS